MTTHYMEEADELCDVVAIMHHGRVTAVDNPAALKAAVGHDASLDDVFVHYTGSAIGGGRTFREAAPNTPYRPAAWVDTRPLRDFVRQDAHRGGGRGAQAAARSHRTADARVQPTLWLLVFGQVFTRVRAHPHRRDQLPATSWHRASWRRACCSSPSSTGSPSSGNAIWAFIHKFLVSPTPARGAGAGQGAFRGRARPLAGGDHLLAGVVAWACRSPELGIRARCSACCSSWRSVRPSSRRFP